MCAFGAGVMACAAWYVALRHAFVLRCCTPVLRACNGAGFMRAAVLQKAANTCAYI